MTNGPYREWMQRKSAGQKQNAFDVFASANLLKLMAVLGDNHQ